MNPIGNKVDEAGVRNLFHQTLHRRRKEHIIVCGTKNNVITYFKDVTEKGTNSKETALCNIWKVCNELKNTHSKEVWICHNHIKGPIFPSKQDKEFTNIFNTKANSLNMTLIEHYIQSMSVGNKNRSNFYGIIHYSFL